MPSVKTRRQIATWHGMFGTGLGFTGRFLWNPGFIFDHRGDSNSHYWEGNILKEVIK